MSHLGVPKRGFCVSDKNRARRPTSDKSDGAGKMFSIHQEGTSPTAQVTRNQSWQRSRKKHEVRQWTPSERGFPLYVY